MGHVTSTPSCDTNQGRALPRKHCSHSAQNSIEDMKGMWRSIDCLSSSSFATCSTAFLVPGGLTQPFPQDAACSRNTQGSWQVQVAHFSEISRVKGFRHRWMLMSSADCLYPSLNSAPLCLYSQAVAFHVDSMTTISSRLVFIGWKLSTSFSVVPVKGPELSLNGLAWVKCPCLRWAPRPGEWNASIVQAPLTCPSLEAGHEVGRHRSHPHLSGRTIT